MDKTVNEVLKIFNNKWNKQVILYGPPGTSKTYSATIIAAAMLAGAESEEDIKNKIMKSAVKNPDISDTDDLYTMSDKFLKGRTDYKLVQFHPSYSYEDFVRGITVTTKDGKTTYEVQSKIIEKFCLDNKDKKEAPIVLVIDEINRAPLASVLGELIYGLEYRGSEITTPYELDSKERLVIPENLYIIGTMNTADRSIGSIDYAVRRRFAFIPVNSEPSAIKDSWNCIGKRVEELYEKIMKAAFAETCKEDPELDINDIKIGHTYFLGKKGNGQADENAEMEYMDYRMTYQIEPIYQEYVKDGIMKKDGFDKLKGIYKEWRSGKGIEDKQ